MSARKPSRNSAAAPPRATRRRGTKRAPQVPAAELRQFLAEIDVSQAEFGAAFGATGQTVRRWLVDGGKAPAWVGVVMGLIRQLRAISAGAELPFRARYERKAVNGAPGDSASRSRPPGAMADIGQPPGFDEKSGKRR